MIKRIISGMLFATTAHAQQWIPYDYGTTSPNLDVYFTHTYDSDSYKTNSLLIGGYTKENIGAFVGYSEYSSRSFTEYSQVAEVAYKSSIISGKGGARVINGHSNFIGDVEHRGRLSNNLSYGVSGVYDIVDSINGIKNNIRSFYTGMDIDYQPVERVSIAGVLSNTYYTDDNTRQMLRGKMSYVVVPEYGVSVYYKAKAQHDTSPGSKNYYSPKELYENSIGVSIRERFASVVVTGAIDFGIQDATSSNNVKTNQSIHTYQLGIQTSPTTKNGVTYGVVMIQTNSGNNYNSSDGYSWAGINGWVKIPF